MRVSVLLVLCALLEVTQAFMLSPVARGPAAVAASSTLVTDRSAQACVGMACRNNLKKDKRIRNRVNAFRFKKAPSGFKRSFNKFEDRTVAAKNANDDAAFNSMMYVQTAAADAAKLEAAAAAPALALA